MSNKANYKQTTMKQKDNKQKANYKQKANSNQSKIQ